MTIALWMRPERATRDGQSMSVVRKGRHVSAIYYLIYYGGHMRLGINDIGWNTGGYRFPEMGRWHHVAGTYDGTFRLLYVDGKLVDRQYYRGTIFAVSQPFGIGFDGIADGNAEWFEGAVDDVRIYDRALSAKEIRRLHGLGQDQVF